MIARRSKEVDLKNFYKEFLRHTCNSLPNHRRLTNMEIEVLTEFWILEGDLITHNRFSTSVKKHIREQVFNFNSHASLENYISSMVKKGFVKRDKKTLFITPGVNLSKSKLRDERKVTLVYEFNLV